jgi:hypothetical protein
MRILDADKADITMVVKRSMSPASSAPITLSTTSTTPLMLFDRGETLRQRHRPSAE